MGREFPGQPWAGSACPAQPCLLLQPGGSYQRVWTLWQAQSGTGVSMAVGLSRPGCQSWSCVWTQDNRVGPQAWVLPLAVLGVALLCPLSNTSALAGKSRPDQESCAPGQPPLL